MSFFKDIVKAINMLRKKGDKKAKTGVYKSYSVFEDFLLFLDEDDENYENTALAADLCDAALKITVQKAALEKKLKEYNSILKEIKCYEQLTPAETSYFKDLADKVLSLSGEKENLKYKMIDFNKGIDKLITLEDAAPAAIKKMEEAEAKERAVLQDIAYIRAEKESLESEKESLEFADKFIYYGSIVLVAAFSAAVMAFVFINFLGGGSLFLPLTILCFAMIIFVPLIIIFKRKVVFELKLNHKKQVKIVVLLNKKNTVYAYYRGFLNYEYNRYGVKSALGLKRNLKSYDNYKHITKRYDNIRSIMYETEKELEQFLKEKNIKDMSISIEEFVRTLNIDDKIAYSKEVTEKRSQVQKQLDELDKKHEVIWDNIIELNISDKTKDGLVEKMIRTYLEETEKITFDPEDDAEEDFPEDEE